MSVWIYVKYIIISISNSSIKSNMKNILQNIMKKFFFTEL